MDEGSSCRYVSIGDSMMDWGNDDWSIDFEEKESFDSFCLRLKELKI